MTPDEAIQHFTELKTAYGLAYGGPHGARVLEDLIPYCHEKRTTFHTDDAIRNVLEGRRQVLLRVREFLDLTPEQLVALNCVTPLTGDKADG